MDAVNDFLIFLDGFLGSAIWFPTFLLSVGIFFTFYLGFPQIRYFKHAIGVVLGKFDKAGAKGDTSHFQALSTALSGTVGTGNIGGVALALHLGGPAALFWMWMTAIVGMTTKFSEVVLGMQYRQTNASDGQVSGGPMYYIAQGLGQKWLAGVYAFLTGVAALGIGNMVQANTVATSVQESLGVAPTFTGIVIVGCVAAVILGGVQRLGRTAEYFFCAFALGKPESLGAPSHGVPLA